MLSLNQEEKRIYTLVVKRFLTCFYPSYDFKKIRVELTAEGESFSAAGREIIELGGKRSKRHRRRRRRSRRAGTSKPAPRGFLCV